jgi:hypothetical protein
VERRIAVGHAILSVPEFIQSQDAPLRSGGSRIL